MLEGSKLLLFFSIQASHGFMFMCGYIKCKWYQTLNE